MGLTHPRTRAALATLAAAFCGASHAAAQSGPAPTQYPPGRYPPGQYPPGQYPPGQYPPAQQPPPSATPPPPPAGQAAPPPDQHGGPASWGYSAGAVPPPRQAPVADDDRAPAEIGVLYGVSVGYGIGLGVWLDAELGIDDPGIRFIPPTILGLAAPVGVFLLDRNTMPEGLPAATAAGMFIGAGEGLGIALLQTTAADDADAWGFRGVSRSVALGSTLGAVGGYVVGHFMEPSPELSTFVASGTAWGSTIGASFGYGASASEDSYGDANETAALGGLIGLNVGLLATAGLSMAVVPSWRQIGWMWGGAAIGAAASAPVYLFYLGDDKPPAKRGLLFTGTAATLGVAAGGLFSADWRDGSSSRPSRFALGPTITHVTPMSVPGGAGLSVGGILH